MLALKFSGHVPCRQELFINGYRLAFFVKRNRQPLGFFKGRVEVDERAFQGRAGVIVSPLQNSLAADSVPQAAVDTYDGFMQSQHVLAQLDDDGGIQDVRQAGLPGFQAVRRGGQLPPVDIQEQHFRQRTPLVGIRATVTIISVGPFVVNH